MVTSNKMHHEKNASVHAKKFIVPTQDFIVHAKELMQDTHVSRKDAKEFPHDEKRPRIHD